MGAPYNDGTGNNAGHVRVYELVGRVPSSAATPEARVTLSVDGDTPHLRWQADATTFVDVALPVAVAPSTMYKIAVTYDPTAYNAGSGTEPDVGAGPQDDRALKVYVGVDGGPLLLPEIASAEDAWPPAVQPALIVAPLTAGSSLSMATLNGWSGYDGTKAWSLVLSDLVVTQSDTIVQWDSYGSTTGPTHAQISWRDWQSPYLAWHSEGDTSYQEKITFQLDVTPHYNSPFSLALTYDPSLGTPDFGCAAVHSATPCAQTASDPLKVYYKPGSGSWTMPDIKHED